MLDYRFIKENLDAVKENIMNRNMSADADAVVELYDMRTALVTKRQELQQRRNENAAAMKGKMDADARQTLIDEGKRIKDAVSEVEKDLEEIEAKLEECADCHSCKFSSCYKIVRFKRSVRVTYDNTLL